MGSGGGKASIHTGTRADGSRTSGPSAHFSVCVSSALAGKQLVGAREAIFRGAENIEGPQRRALSSQRSFCDVPGLDVTSHPLPLRQPPESVPKMHP